MMDIHLFQVLFLQCLKLFTQNAFDSWVDAFMLLLYFMLMIDIVKKKKFIHLLVIAVLWVNGTPLVRGSQS